MAERSRMLETGRPRPRRGVRCRLSSTRRPPCSVRPGGRVVATDISPKMLAVARGTHAPGVDNIDFLEMDAEHLQFEDKSFHAVTNVYGLMFCPDTHGALDEVHRVLKPGGRCALVTWDEASEESVLQRDRWSRIQLSFTPPNGSRGAWPVSPGRSSQPRVDAADARVL